MVYDYNNFNTQFYFKNHKSSKNTHCKVRIKQIHLFFSISVLCILPFENAPQISFQMSISILSSSNHTFNNINCASS